MKETATLWFEFARQDLRMAELALREEIYNQVCFHSQQCVEKTLKALLADQGKSIPRTHSIVDLLSSLSLEIFKDISDELGQMDAFYIPTRYPDVLLGMLSDGMPNRDEAEHAIHMAQTVIFRIQDKREGKTFE